MKKIYSFLSLLVLLNIGCTSKKFENIDDSPIRKVFYPIDDLSIKKLYIYDYYYNERKTKQVYSSLEVRKENKDTLLLFEAYNGKKQIESSWVMKVTHDKVKLLRIKYFKDPTRGYNETESKIMRDIFLTFKYDSLNKKGDLFEYENSNMWVGNNRAYKNIIDSLRYKGKRYFAMEFFDAWIKEVKTDSVTFTTSTKTKYIEGIGKFESVTDLKKGNYVKTRLDTIIKFSDWKRE